MEYKEFHFDCRCRIDILVENELVVKLKSVDEIKGIHQAQPLTYMELSGVTIGLLIKRFVL